VSGEHEVRAASKVRGMLPLNDARWTALSDAYGASTGIPKLLAHAATLPEDFGEGAEPYFSLWSALCHQGDVYSASYAALPHLVRIVEENQADSGGLSSFWSTPSNWRGPQVAGRRFPTTSPMRINALLPASRLSRAGF